MNELERDLRRQINKKLELWVGDSFELYEMGDLSPQVASGAILEALLRAAATTTVIATGMTANEIASVLYDMVQRKRAAFEKQRQAEGEQ